jgi:putative DNA primase/helicase
MQHNRIQDRARGKWQSILPALGIDKRYLSNKHGPCPACGGEDRYRFDDKAGSGSFYCNGCGAGSGVDLVMRVAGVDFLGAKRLIEEQLPDAVIHVPRADQNLDPDRFLRLWRAGQSVSEHDPGGAYLASRGIDLDGLASLRHLPRASYRHNNGRTTQHHGLIALYMAPDLSSGTIETTYLDMFGRRPIELKPSRKLLVGKKPKGGSVRLSPSADTMGIAEGVVTALSARQLFDVPVWAALSDGGLVNWQPPPTARNIIVFGDNDASYAGQNAAYSLAYRLRRDGLNVEVRIPDDAGDDWNDVLLTDKGMTCSKFEREKAAA